MPWTTHQGSYKASYTLDMALPSPDHPTDLIAQMPPGIPVATVAINGSLNAGILAAQMIASGNDDVMEKTIAYKSTLKNKIVKANEELTEFKFDYRVN